MSWDIELDDQLLQDLYAWIDQIPLSRPKKRIEKDFSDGVMVAELIKYYFPSWVKEFCEKRKKRMFSMRFIYRWIYITMQQRIVHNRN
jgi:hypothetical protein